MLNKDLKRNIAKLLLPTVIMLLLPSSVKALSQEELLASVNRVRSDNGRLALTLNDRLINSAQAKAVDMCEKDYWAHGEWESFIDEAGYSYVSAGENLARGFVDAQATVGGWSSSPAHFDNMVGVYREAGFGYVACPSYQGAGSVIITVNHFGFGRPENSLIRKILNLLWTPIQFSVIMGNK